MNTIIGIYKITNTITGDFYIGSSKDVKRRWKEHKWPSTWKRYSNSPLYQDMKKFGIDKFEFQVIAEVEEGQLKEMEQQFIEKLNPIYNDKNAKGWDIERRKESQKEYHKSDKYKEYQKEYNKSDKRKEYHKSDKYKEYQKEYNKEYEKTDKRKKYHNKYNNQLCFYNGETLTLCALSSRFRRRGIPNPTLEAKKYLLQ